jgi:hypothetical protein
MTTFEPNLIEESLSFQDYRKLFTDVLEGKASVEYNDKQTHFTGLNEKRVNRLLKKDRTLPEVEAQIRSIDKPLHWLVITEAWCGDAAQVVPPLLHLANLNENIQTSFLLRDQNLDLMDQFLTDGSRSIPKVIILDPENDYQILGDWGPRPADAHDLMLAGLNKWRQMPAGDEKDKFYANLYADLQRWYARDKTVSTQKEFISSITNYLKEAEVLA